MISFENHWKIIEFSIKDLEKEWRKISSPIKGKNKMETTFKNFTESLYQTKKRMPGDKKITKDLLPKLLENMQVINEAVLQILHELEKNLDLQQWNCIEERVKMLNQLGKNVFCFFETEARNDLQRDSILCASAR